MKVCRRSFLKGGMMMAGAVTGGGCAMLSGNGSGGKKFYKGQFHTHTWWSDGRAAPEQAVAYYKERGYDFLGITDHNVYGEGHRVKRLKKDNSGEMAILKAYRKNFPSSAVVKETEGGDFDVELKTVAELRKMFEESDKFILLDGVEGTTKVIDQSGIVNQVHMSYLNVPGVPSYFRKCGTKGTVVQRISEAHKAVKELAAKMGREEMFILNHPIWTWYDVLAEDLIANPDVRFFEVCNGGSPYASGKGLPKDGFDTDRFWDVVNAFRARRGQPLLYGVGTDDAHHYFGTKDYVPSIHCVPMNAWCKVRATGLSQPELIAAMKAGDFAVCEGVEPDDFSFDPATGTLSVSVGAKKYISRTIEFIVTKKDFSEKPVKTVDILPADAPDDRRTRFFRKVNIYDKNIGKTVKSVTGEIGESVSASYKMAADDLYVRARIKSPEKPVASANLHPKYHVAWTQPYLNVK